MKTNPKDALLASYEKDLAETKRQAEEINLSVDADQDYDVARTTLKNLIAKSNDALDSLMDLAHGTEHPRAFEALAVLLKTAGDLAKQLIDLQKRRHELDVLNNPDIHKRLGPPQSGSTNNTAIFVGSTPELQKLIRGAGEKIIDIAESDIEDAEL
jgi:hypothetical protein